MTVHITNLYGMSQRSVAQIAQNRVAEIATSTLGFKELGIYYYKWEDEPKQTRTARFDGILASVAYGDTIIFQSPTWNPIEWDFELWDRMSIYRDVKKIIFVEDIGPLMFESNKYLLPKYIDFYNKADVLILASKKMYDYLRENGLKEKKVVFQKFWDHPCQINYNITPKNKKVINFSGTPKKFTFVNDWKSTDVPLNVYSSDKPNENNHNINYLGWKDDDTELLNVLRQAGGFGLVWTDEPYYHEYMTKNCTYKLSTYLAAGIPVIVNNDLQPSATIQEKHLGITVDNLDEAISKINNISDTEYNEMQKNVDSFGKLIRNGYFTKKALIDAVFKARY